MRIGIILTGDYGWAGGVYYSLNIIKLLSRISATKNIQVVAIVNASTPGEVINELPKQHVEISYLDQKPFLYKLYYKFFGNRFVADINVLKLNVLYPLIAYDPAHAKLNCKVLYWLYDFQHKFLPALFSSEELKSRDLTFQNIASFGKDIVFSSYDSKSHFDQFYKESKANRHVYNFVSLLEHQQPETSTAVAISEKYFIVCNQFWPHKNHMAVFKALALLLKEKKDIHIVFTGKFDDERNKVYVNELKAFIDQHSLRDHVTLTGFISREEQIQLIKNARAIIQPSFFEGWSTVIEDAKALNKLMIVSDIPVNREQIAKNAWFFVPESEQVLAEHIITVLNKQDEALPLDYEKNIADSEASLMQLFGIK
jgi:glycosyltransferase involved in cell wall biosynthesis